MSHPVTCDFSYLFSFGMYLFLSCPEVKSNKYLVNLNLNGNPSLSVSENR